MLAKALVMLKLKQREVIGIAAKANTSGRQDPVNRMHRHKDETPKIKT